MCFSSILMDKFLAQLLAQLQAFKILIVDGSLTSKKFLPVYTHPQIDNVTLCSCRHWALSNFKCFANLISVILPGHILCVCKQYSHMYIYKIQIFQVFFYIKRIIYSTTCDHFQGMMSEKMLLLNVGGTGDRERWYLGLTCLWGIKFAQLFTVCKKVLSAFSKSRIKDIFIISMQCRIASQQD